MWKLNLSPFTPGVDISTTFFNFLRQKNKKKHLLGFSFLPDDHYNLSLSSGEKVNSQKCFNYSYETLEVEKEVVDI